jgi:IS30 family transposase
MKYKQLAAEERFLIAVMRHRGVSLAGITRFLGRHRSTIGREVNRNRSGYDGGYRSARAHEKTEARRERSRRNMQFGKAEIGWVATLIRERWSPEQISGYLKKCGELRISHETIYRHIWRDKKGRNPTHEPSMGTKAAV